MQIFFFLSLGVCSSSIFTSKMVISILFKRYAFYFEIYIYQSISILIFQLQILKKKNTQESYFLFLYSQLPSIHSFSSSTSSTFQRISVATTRIQTLSPTLSHSNSL